jgi:hypothetical protein
MNGLLCIISLNKEEKTEERKKTLLASPLPHLRTQVTLDSKPTRSAERDFFLLQLLQSLSRDLPFLMAPAVTTKS